MSWKQVEDFYEEVFNIDSELLNLSIDFDILSLMVSGWSNSYISRTLNLDESDIETIGEKYLQFSGWIVDVGFNPYYIYKNSGKVYHIYKLQIENINGRIDEDDLKTSFHICELYDNYKKELEEDYV